jgi:transmembrane 9 superfamily protein 2/4
VLPFGAAYVELFYILSSIWMDQYYYVFGFTFMVMVILVITCGELAMLFVYFQLCAEDYRWWWRSFLAAGSTAFYVFAYSCVWFQLLEPSSMAITYILYFGYMGLISFAIFLVTGTIGFISCLWFTTTIFSSIKVD